MKASSSVGVTDRQIIYWQAMFNFESRPQSSYFFPVELREPIEPIYFFPNSPFPFPFPVPRSRSPFLFPYSLFPIPYSLFPYFPIPLFPYSPIPLFPYSPIPRFPDSPIPRFPDSPIPRFPDSPMPILEIAEKSIYWYIWVFVSVCVNSMSCLRANISHEDRYTLWRHFGVAVF